jgi:hypothetical protein
MKNPRGRAPGVRLCAGFPASVTVAPEGAFALGLLACQFAGTADGLGLLARFLDGGFLEMLLELHLAEDPFALKLLLQGTKRLFDVVVANADLHVVVTTFLS